MAYDPSTWGTVSDWVSSVSSALTFGIAIMAYKKAPDWIKQRYQSEGLTIAKTIIDDEIPNILREVTDFDSTLIDYTKHMSDRNINQEKLHRVKLQALSNLIFSKNLSLFTSLNNLQKVGWKIKKELNVSITDAACSAMFIVYHIQQISEFEKHIVATKNIQTDQSVIEDRDFQNKTNEILADIEKELNSMTAWLYLFRDSTPYHKNFNIN